MYNFSFTQINTHTVFVTPMDIQYNYCHYPEFAKGRFHINSIQKKFENMYLIIDSSVLNWFSAFNCRLNEEQKFSNILVEKNNNSIFDQKSQFSKTSPKLDCKK